MWWFAENTEWGEKNAIKRKEKCSKIFGNSSKKPRRTVQVYEAKKKNKDIQGGKH